MHPMSQATGDLAREVIRRLDGDTDRAAAEEMAARVCGTSFGFMTARVTREVLRQMERAEVRQRAATKPRQKLPWPLRLVFRDA